MTVGTKVQFRTLHFNGGTQREISEVVRQLMNGKSNNAGFITLDTSGATNTTIFNERIGYDSVIILTPINDVSAAQYLPYGAWHDETDQSAANTTTAYAMKFSDSDFNYMTSVESDGVNPTELTVQVAGLYNLQFSAQLNNSTNAQEVVDIWFRKNGTDIADSNSRFTLEPRDNNNVPFRLVAGLNFYVALDAGDYVQIMWCTTDTGVTIEHFTGLTSPTRPDIPSIIATMSYVAVNGYTDDLHYEPYISSKAQGSAVITHLPNYVSDMDYGYIIVG
jgi:hypothetical protein